MNTSAETTFLWGDSEHTFALKGKQIEHLEKACGPIQDILMRLLQGHARYSDITNVIHLGLEGGGKSPVEAKQLMDRFVEGQPISGPKDPSSPLATAQAIIGAAWFGVETVSPGEAPAGESPADPSPSTSLDTAPHSSETQSTPEPPIP